MADGNMDTPGSIFPTPHAIYFASILKLVAKTMRNITSAVCRAWPVLRADRETTITIYVKSMWVHSRNSA